MTQAEPAANPLEPRLANMEVLIQYMAQTQRSIADNIVLMTENLVVLNQSQQRHEQEMKQINERLDVQQGQIKLLLDRLLGQSGQS
jgi:methylmalonyl-CoA mutase cobalamin-binding subunit